MSSRHTHFLFFDSLSSVIAGAQDLPRGWWKLPEGTDGVERGHLAEPAIEGGPVQQLLRQQPARVPHCAQLPGRWPVALEEASPAATAHHLLPFIPAATPGPEGWEYLGPHPSSWDGGSQWWPWTTPHLPGPQKPCSSHPRAEFLASTPQWPSASAVHRTPSCSRKCVVTCRPLHGRYGLVFRSRGLTPGDRWQQVGRPPVLPELLALRPEQL